jgi:hypothetical protein
MQPSEAFQVWSNERDTVDAEMSALFTTDLLAAPEERQVRKMRFMALVERRDAAARGLLEPVRRSTSQFRARIRPKRQEARAQEAQEAPVENRQSKEVAPPPNAYPVPVPAASEQGPTPAIRARIAALMHSLFDDLKPRSSD